MNAVLLAAGRGSRLKELTDEHPKCLTKLAGKSLLSWQIEALNSAGIGDLTVVRGYGREHLNGSEYQVVDNLNWSNTNMVATLRCAHETLLAGAVVSYSDIVYHPSIVEQLLEDESDIAITYDRLWLQLWSDRFENPLEDAETFVAIDGRVAELGNRADHVDQIKGQFMGVIKFSAKGWRLTEDYLSSLADDEVAGLDMTGLLGRLMKNGISVGAVPIDGRWCEADAQSDLKLYEERLSEHDALGTAWTHDWRW